MPTDKQLDKRTDDWLKQQVAEGQLSQEEYESVSLDRETSGCTRPEWMWWDYSKAELPPKLDCVDAAIYTNYPAWTMREIADRLCMTRSAVQRAISRVRRMYPGLRNDPSGDQGLPNLSHMRPIDSGSYEEIRENEHKF